MVKPTMAPRRRIVHLAILWAYTGLAFSRALAESAGLTITSPIPWQVVQRVGFDPRHAQMDEIGGPKLGYADVTVTAAIPGIEDRARAQYRVVPLADAFGQGCDWTDLEGIVRAGRLIGTARVGAGGWYRLEIRSRVGPTAVTGAVGPFGVGEVFIVAGQSYAEGANQERLKVEDPQGRVVAYDVVKKSWAVANDPFPNVNTGGTIWPAFGNDLLPLVHVPLGIVNVAVGGTASREWMPGEKLYKIFSAAGTTLGRFRAVLWYQGESDVIEWTTTEKYFENILTIHRSLANEWGFAPPWIVAKATYHPDVYHRPIQEQRIRDAQDRLWRQPGFLPGPDTDILGGENRAHQPPHYRHFTGLGQRRAGLMWFSSVWQLLNAP